MWMNLINPIRRHSNLEQTFGLLCPRNDIEGRMRLNHITKKNDVINKECHKKYAAMLCCFITTGTSQLVLLQFVPYLYNDIQLSGWS